MLPGYTGEQAKKMQEGKPQDADARGCGRKKRRKRKGIYIPVTTVVTLCLTLNTVL
jgi:hypothetical protein